MQVPASKETTNSFQMQVPSSKATTNSSQIQSPAPKETSSATNSPSAAPVKPVDLGTDSKQLVGGPVDQKVSQSANPIACHCISLGTG